MVGKLEDEQTTWRGRRRRYIINKDIKDTGREGVGWMHLTEDRNQRLVHVNNEINLRIPYKAKNRLNNCQLLRKNSGTVRQMHQLQNQPYLLQPALCGSQNWLNIQTAAYAGVLGPGNLNP